MTKRMIGSQVLSPPKTLHLFSQNKKIKHHQQYYDYVKFIIFCIAISLFCLIFYVDSNNAKLLTEQPQTLLREQTEEQKVICFNSVVYGQPIIEVDLKLIESVRSMDPEQLKLLYSKARLECGYIIR